jgi:hypothetical protein
MELEKRRRGTGRIEARVGAEKKEPKMKKGNGKEEEMK